MISEREKYAVTGRNQERAASLAANYQRRKLLVKDLPKAVGHSDFAASYEKGALSTNDVVGAFNRISKFGKMVLTSHLYRLLTPTAFLLTTVLTKASVRMTGTIYMVV